MMIHRCRVAFNSIHGTRVHRVCDDERQEQGEVEASGFELHGRYYSVSTVSLYVGSLPTDS